MFHDEKKRGPAVEAPFSLFTFHISLCISGLIISLSVHAHPSPSAENQAYSTPPTRTKNRGSPTTTPGASQAKLRNAPAQVRVDGASPLDVALGHGEVVLEVVAVEDQPLDVHRGPLFLLDLDLDVFHGVVR